MDSESASPLGICTCTRQKPDSQVLTVFIGGNHEASNYLWELYHGGWVAPNIYYLGATGVVNVGGLRIAGLSGIYKHDHYDWGMTSCPCSRLAARPVAFALQFSLPVYKMCYVKARLTVRYICHGCVSLRLYHVHPQGTLRSPLIRRRPCVVPTM